VTVQIVVYYLHRFWVKLRTGQILPSLSLMADVVEVLKASQSRLDLNEHILRCCFVFDILDSKDNDNKPKR